MDTYIINGVEVELDTFDAVTLDLMVSEADILSNAEDKFKREAEEGRPNFTEYADAIRDFFDVLIGEGTSEKCFGKSRNIMVLHQEAIGFASALYYKVAGMQAVEPAVKESPVVNLNREQRRAKEREERRKAAQCRAAQRNGT